MIGIEIIDHSPNNRIMKKEELTETGRQQMIYECEEMIKGLKEFEIED